MFLPKGSKLYTRQGFTPIEQIEGKAVEVSSLPYYDMLNSLLHDPVPQTITINYSHSEPSSGLEGMPMHRTTNFLCSTPYSEAFVDREESAYFLNTMQSYHVGCGAIVTNNFVPTSWLDYTYINPNYEEAVNGVAYYAAALNQLMHGGLDEIEYQGTHDNTEFISKTDVNVYQMLRVATKRGRWPDWKFVDYDNTRMYFTNNEYPSLNKALIAISHLIRYPLNIHDGKLKLYLPIINLDKVGHRTVADFLKVLGINAKRKRMNADISKHLNKDSFVLLSTTFKDMFCKGAFPGKVPSVAKSNMDTVQMMNLPINLRTIPVKGRVASITFPKSCWFPMEFFENVEWYNLHSATPKLLFVEAPTGLLFIISTIGGR